MRCGQSLDKHCARTTTMEPFALVGIPPNKGQTEPSVPSEVPILCCAATNVFLIKDTVILALGSSKVLFNIHTPCQLEGRVSTTSIKPPLVIVESCRSMFPYHF